jgi:hypothetical protein
VLRERGVTERESSDEAIERGSRSESSGEAMGRERRGEGRQWRPLPRLHNSYCVGPPNKAGDCEPCSITWHDRVALPRIAAFSSQTGV